MIKKHYKPDSYKLGLITENFAAFFLTIKLYRIIERRYKTKAGEIDIIALKGKTLIFIEVKNRKNNIELFESVTLKQQRRIYKAAEIFIGKNPLYNHYQKRFDAILIKNNLLPIHIKNAW